MLKQTNRLKIIYLFLKENPADAKSLLDYLKSKDAEISLRQLQRDIVDVENNFLHNNEKLTVKIVQNRKKVWLITTENSKHEFNQNTINTLYLSVLVSPNVLIKNRIDDFKIFKDLIEKSINDKDKNLNIDHGHTQLVNTHFYEVTKDLVFNKNIDQLIWAVTNRKRIRINELINDFTVDNHLFKDIVSDFSPVKLLYHRGTFLVAGIKSGKNNVVIYEVSQIKKFDIKPNGYDFDLFSKKIDAELDQRFGITKNIDNKVYYIVLEFTSVTGALVSKYFWHESQKFTKNGNIWTMIMNCGINRELLGWLFQWMYNVRVVSPQILKDKYNETLNLMIDNKVSDKPLVYRNIFEP